MLVVLKKWTSPTWTRVQWDEDDDPPGESVLGLVSTGESDAPTWQYLAMPGETLTISYADGNTSKIDWWVVAVDGAFVEPNHNIVTRMYIRVQSGASHAMSNLNQKTWDPFRRRVKHIYSRFQSGTNRTLSRFNRSGQDRIGAGFTRTLMKFGHGLDQTRNIFAPKYERFQEGISKALSPFRRRRKRKQNSLGKVMGFATQEIPESSEIIS